MVINPSVQAVSIEKVLPLSCNDKAFDRITMIYRIFFPLYACPVESGACPVEGGDER
jgi:hypothetical protein